MFLSYVIYDGMMQNGVRRVVQELKISEDGRYVLSSVKRKYFKIIAMTSLYLYDLEKKTKRYIYVGINDHTPDFLQPGNNIIWQSDLDTVYVMSPDLEIKQRIEYGERVIAQIATENMEKHITLTQHGRLTLHHGDKIIVLADRQPKEYLYQERVEIKFHPNGILLVGGETKNIHPYDQPRLLSNYSIPQWWDIHTGQIIGEYRFPFLCREHTSELSPLGDYVLITNKGLNYFNIKTQEQTEVLNCESHDYLSDLLSNHPSLSLPTYFKNKQKRGEFRSDVIAAKFIDDMHYMVFYRDMNLISLHALNEVKPIKLLALNRYPWPSVDREHVYTIATAPKVHRLVTAKKDHNGIMAYDYDPSTQSLTLIWNARR